MPGNPTADSEPLPASRIIPGPTHLRQYPAHNLVAWQPQGVLDDQLLDEIGVFRRVGLRGGAATDHSKF